MAKVAKSQVSDPIQRELDSIKRLLILLLLKGGATQEEIGTALQIDRSAVSRMFPSRKIRKFSQKD